MWPSAHIPFSISSINRLERLVTTYSAASISCRRVDKPSSSLENWRAEPSETFSACLTSLGRYSIRSTKRFTYCLVSKIGTLSISRTRGNESSVSMGLGNSRGKLRMTGC
jgi:hypothetical protein